MEKLIHPTIEGLNKMFDLQKEAMDKYFKENEAIEFAEWILCNYNTSEDGMSLCWHNADTRLKKNKYNTKELYEIFKNK